MALETRISGEFGVGKIDFTQLGGGAVRRDGIDKLRETVSVKDFGAVGDGVVDDTDAIQAAIDHVKTNGGSLFVPTGTYAISTLDIGSGVKPWALRGAGRLLTKFVRNSDTSRSLFFGNYASLYGYELTDFSIDSSHDIYPNGNHVIVIGYTNDCTVARITVTNYGHSAVLFYAGNGLPLVKNNFVFDVHAIGNGITTDNGIMMANAENSGFYRCRVENAKGDPGFGIQFKTSCTNVFATDCSAYNCEYGYGHGYEDETYTAASVSFARVNGFHAQKCDTGVSFGRGSFNSGTNLLIDMEGLGQSAVVVGENAKHNRMQLIVKNMPASRRIVRIQNTANNNYFEVTNATPSSSYLAAFDVDTYRNIVKLLRQSDPDVRTSGSGLADMVTFAGSVGNGWQYEGYEMQEYVDIVSGAITIANSLATMIYVDTEENAATDDLDTINFPQYRGSRIVLATQSNTQDVVIKHATGNIYLSGLADITLTSRNRRVELQWNSSDSTWVQV
ncbi:MAG: glycosyl hydrolase family 28-related protein [Candidatus Accumulibacter sp. UW25]|jgi:hypothetical protein